MFRLETMPCELTLRSQEKVSLNPSVADPPQIPETDHPALSEEVLPISIPAATVSRSGWLLSPWRSAADWIAVYSRVAAIANGLATICNTSRAVPTLPPAPVLRSSS